VEGPDAGGATRSGMTRLGVTRIAVTARAFRSVKTRHGRPRLRGTAREKAMQDTSRSCSLGAYWKFGRQG